MNFSAEHTPSATLKVVKFHRFNFYFKEVKENVSVISEEPLYKYTINRKQCPLASK